ncbi:uncharacterized protein ZBIST_2072 [Zygosaccharomyces bailii]|nr:uncharacterized protein ZBAI_01181 [Zygosaccharomyces bailii ISA1307]SJM85151.1 uncharacterized protein ZBIST_2072 [Zygosaccharomyces bailii]
MRINTDLAGSLWNNVETRMLVTTQLQWKPVKRPPCKGKPVEKIGWGTGGRALPESTFSGSSNYDLVEVRLLPYVWVLFPLVGSGFLPSVWCCRLATQPR